MADSEHGEFVSMTDDEIVKLAKADNLHALEYILEKYKNFVKSRSRPYFLIGADREDIIQEGMIGLYKAIRDYDTEKYTNFRAFAEMCITRQIITAIKTATRRKHMPLNSYLSLSHPVFDEESDKTLLDTITEHSCLDPEEIIINKEDYTSIGKKINELLSPKEMEILSIYLQGKSYQEISDELGISHKSIDNALQRVKRKLDKNIRN
ncbi:MAG: RNA polymerase sporulation sigma factor SigH [Clostridia bacterium]|nr:RNA polymerase sporulation sigma factor SigH [Clostridia bacterium]